MLLEDAIERILVPEPLTGQVRTLEAQLTAAYQATATPGVLEVITPAPTSTPTESLPASSPTPSPTGTTPGPSPTQTPTPQGYP
jgi:uncharacterized membrane protein